MRSSRLLYDGLWRCLCPSFDERALLRTVNATLLTRPSRPSSKCNQSILLANLAQRRRFATSPRLRIFPDGKTETLDAFFRLAEKQLEKGEQDGSFRFIQAETPNLKNAKADDLIEALRFLRDGNYHKVPDPHDRIVLLVKALVQQPGFTLNAFVYECMMDAMADPKGSALGVRKLLRDMAEQGIAPTAEVCYRALSALAIHPDYTLRETVVSLMSAYWYDMTQSARQDIAVGMLREGQHELALAEFAKMHEDEGKVDLWVYDIFIIEFARARFLDEMLQVLRQRKHARGTDNTFRTLLLHALDLFTRAYHEEGTMFVWDYVVTHKILNPPNAVIENVLGTASHHGNMALASEALDILSNRGKVSAHHYEALVDAFAATEDIIGAFGVLSIMERNGVSVGRGATRSVYRAMRKNPWLITEASDALGRTVEGQEVPLQTIGVTIEAMAKVQGTRAALGLYHNTFTLSGKQPDKHILKFMVLNCSSMETMWSLAKDYGVMIPQDKPLDKDSIPVYERMIPACAQFGDFDRAFEFAEKIMAAARSDVGKDRKTWQFEYWVMQLIEHAVVAQDQRVWPIIDEITKDEVMASGKVQQLLRRLQIDRRAETLEARKEEGEGEKEDELKHEEVKEDTSPREAGTMMDSKVVW